MAAGSRRIIAGVSGSIRSLGALRAAVVEGRSTGVPVLAVLTWAPVGGELAYLRAPCPILLRLWEHAARQRMQDAFSQAFGGMPDGVAIRHMVVRGPPGPTLVELADRRDDLLIVGYGGRTRLGCAAHGTVTRYCMARAVPGGGRATTGSDPGTAAHIPQMAGRRLRRALGRITRQHLG